MPKIRQSDMPELYQPYMKVRGKKRRLVGLFVGGCVERGDGSSFRRKAHSHTHRDDPYRGWICIRAAWRLDDQRLLAHELAHILTRQGHTDKFYTQFVELGGRLEDDQAHKNRLAFAERQKLRQQLS